MPILYHKWITRKNLRDNPKSIYLFGDNMERVGFGGQAKEMRGEPNAYGIPTKRTPGMRDKDFFSDTDPTCLYHVSFGLMTVKNMLDRNVTVIVPSDGLGTGLSRLHIYAPELDKLIVRYFHYFTEYEGSEVCPWFRDDI